MQRTWLLLKKLPTQLWWILIFWLLICLNKNYLYISVRLRDSPCDYCLWKWEQRSRKFPCHKGLMYTQIMGWLQLRWAPHGIVCLRLWQLPPWQGLLVFLVIDAFCINVIHWWCLLLYRYGGKAGGGVCVGEWVCMEVQYLIHSEAEMWALRQSILNVSDPQQFTEADQNESCSRGICICDNDAFIRTSVLVQWGEKMLGGGWWEEGERWRWQECNMEMQTAVLSFTDSQTDQWLYSNVNMQIQSLAPNRTCLIVYFIFNQN